MPLASDIKAAARDWAAAAMRRAAFMGAIALFFVVGGAFATAAAWSLLAVELGSAVASAAMAGGFLAVALIALLADHVRSRRKRAATKVPPRRGGPGISPALAEAFVTSVHIGRRMGGVRK